MNVFRSASATNVGMVRQLNEDSLFVNDAAGLWAVADGMGGHQAGDVASQTVVGKLGEVSPCPDLAELVRATRGAIESANLQLLGMSGEFEGHRPGSTVVALALHGTEAAVVWAGDSRIYRLREGEIQQVTRDHSHVQELMDQQLITPEEAETHPMANVITRAVGIEDPVDLDVLHFNVVPGDRFLLCSDGLSRLVTDQEMQDRLNAEPIDNSIAWFIEHALARGAPDNVTVVLVECTEGNEATFADDDDSDATILYPSGGPNL